MNMNKKTIGIIIVVIIIIFAFLLLSSSEPNKPTTYLSVSSEDCSENGNDGEILIHGNLNESDPQYNSSHYWDFENSTINVNLTYSNNTTIEYKLTCDYFGTATIKDLKPGHYKVSASFAGNDKLKGCSIENKPIYVGQHESYSDSSSGGSDSSSENTEYKTTTYTTYRWVYV